ncbi:MAG: GNAT family N-acetyltransferase [Bacteroidetes bacterium]|nr:GNAT family N-acetyltransferase [Bacteroidota bacterium]
MSEVVLATPRLILRPFRPEDAEDFHRNVMADEEVMWFLLGVKSFEETQAFLESRDRIPQEGKPGLWAITLKDDPAEEVVGYVGFLAQTLEEQPVEEISYRLASRLWGQGMATEAARATRDWFFKHTTLESFVGFILPENTASSAVAERIGMRYWKDAIVKGFGVAVYRMVREHWAGSLFAGHCCSP